MQTRLVSRIARSTLVNTTRVRPFSTSTGTRQRGPDGKEYSSSKEIGNPITWANPNGGPSQDDRSSNAWKWVYPIGFGLIIMSSLVSRYRNKSKSDGYDEGDGDKKIISDRSIRMHKAMERLDFATKPVDERKRIKSEYEDEHY